jgi:hypothetical protein
VDGGGNVVAIASGGLKNGFVGVSWGIATRYLAELAAAPTADAAGEVRLSQLFFAQPVQPEARADGVTCGALTLTRVRTATVAELLPGSDNQLGLLQIAESFGKSLPDVEGIAYAIYQHLDTGAAVAVPAELELQAQGAHCRVTGADGRIEMRVSAAEVGSMVDAQVQSVQFEERLRPLLLQIIQPDVAFSYVAPFTRPDGLIVNRRSFVALDPFQAQPPKHLFETLMARANAFAGIATINHNYDVQGINYCQFNRHLPPCADLMGLWDAWMRMVLGTHLSTFPIY